MRIGLLSALCALTLLAGCQRTSSSSHIIVLRINEVMANNSTYVAGEPNELTLDWIEIFNPTGTAVRLEGYTLTDNPARPNRYRFPPHLEVSAGGFLVIWLIGDGELADINLDRAAEGLGDIVLTDRHADFGISAGADTLFLFADGRQIDRIGLVNLPADASFGRFPDGGSDIGQIFAPTPGSPNHPKGAFAPRFAISDQPRVELCAAPTAHASIEFSVLVQEPDEEGDPLDTPTVRLRMLDGYECGPDDQSLERCLELFAEPPPGAEVRDLFIAQFILEVGEEDGKSCETNFETDPVTGETRVGTPADGDCPSETTDGSYNDVRVRVLKFQGELPPGNDPLILQSDKNFPARLIWLEVENSLGHLDFCICHVYGSGCFDVVISEYQPVNPDEEFVCENCAENTGVQTPDWVEIYNFGEDEIDISQFGLVGRNASRDNPTAWLFGRDTGDDPGYSTLGPGKRLLILADTDGGDLLVQRKVFRRVLGRDDLGAPILDMSCRYFSAKFGLDPRRPRERDRFVLTAPASPGSPIQVVIDVAVLDFDQFFRDHPPIDPQNDFNGPVRGLSVIRDLARLNSGDPTPRECLLPGVDAEWCISLCPSPSRCPGSDSGANRLDCGQSVELLDELSIRAASAPAGDVRRCPALGEGVIVTAFAAVNNETASRLEAGEDPSLSVELEYEDSQGQRVVLTLGDGIVAVPDVERQAEARLGTTLLRIEATIPPQVEGVVTILRLTIRDDFLASQDDVDDEIDLSDELGGIGAADSTLSFSYYSGDPPLDALPILSEVFPHNDEQSLGSRFVLPGFEGVRRSDYIELHLSADASVESVDLGGFYLATTPNAGAPLTHARQYRLPDDTPALERGGFLVLVDGPLPDEPPPFPAASISGFPLAPGAGAVFLVGPDRLGNCVIDGISWNRSDVVDPANPFACPRPFPNRQFCFGICPGSLVAVQVSPSPAAPNVFPPIVVGASHFKTDSTETRPNLCDVLDEVNTMKLSAVVFLDREMVLRSGGPDLSVPESLVSAGFELSEGFTVGDGRLSASTANLNVDAPEGYIVAFFSQTAIVPADAGLVRYSVLLEDMCGGTPPSPCGAADCFSFSVDGGDPPEIHINEVNRGYPLPGGGGAGRPWIELFNPGSADVDLGGFSISSVTRNSRMHTFEAGTIVPARGALLLITDGGDPLVGKELPPHVSIEFPWVPVKVLHSRFNDGSCREEEIFGVDCEDSDGSLDRDLTITLSLVDRVDSGSCLVDSFMDVQFCATDPESWTGLGRVPDGGGDIIVIDEPTPGEVAAVPEVTFVRGDKDGDGTATLTDAVAVLDFLFRAADGPACLDTLDVDDSGRIDVSDAVYLLGFLFRGGDAPPSPFPDAGVDPTPDEIPCDAS
jgi:hypothetical protein